MDVRWRAGAGIAVVAGLLGGSSPAAASDREPVRLELRVITFGALDRPELDLARETVHGLLAPAGIHVIWRECAGETCSGSSNGAPFLLVRLMPIAKVSDPAAAGEVIRDPTTKGASVLVYLKRNLDIVPMTRRSPRLRSHPLLASLSVGHVVGLTVAHEVGHSLGLPHCATGPMKSDLTPDDFIAMRASRLRFSGVEAETMRLTLRPSNSIREPR